MINNKMKFSFNVSFDRDKLHNLFYEERYILIQRFSTKKLYLLTRVLIDQDQIFIYNQ